VANGLGLGGRTHAPVSVPRTPRVLVVDDESSISRSLAIAFRRAGYDALSAVSGESAHEILHNSYFDVLILDLRIPDVRGDVLFHLAVSLQPHLRRHTLFITGDVTERAQALIADCQCPVVCKPFEIQEVLAAVASLRPGREASESA
jgi:two-component system, OmpR family, response regulator